MSEELAAILVGILARENWAASAPLRLIPEIAKRIVKSCIFYSKVGG